LTILDLKCLSGAVTQENIHGLNCRFLNKPAIAQKVYLTLIFFKSWQSNWKSRFRNKTVTGVEILRFLFNRYTTIASHNFLF
jgi:hypothetical protein